MRASLREECPGWEGGAGRGRRPSAQGTRQPDGIIPSIRLVGRGSSRWPRGILVMSWLPAPLTARLECGLALPFHNPLPLNPMSSHIATPPGAKRLWGTSLTRHFFGPTAVLGPTEGAASSSGSSPKGPSERAGPCPGPSLPCTPRRLGPLPLPHPLHPLPLQVSPGETQEWAPHASTATHSAPSARRSLAPDSLKQPFWEVKTPFTADS